MKPFKNISAFKTLQKHARRMGGAEYHLKNLIRDNARHDKCGISGGGIRYDYFFQRIDDNVISALAELAEERQIIGQFRQMMTGAIVNRSENRSALHTACRSFSDSPVMSGGRDVMPDIRRIRSEIREFADKIHTGEITGAAGKKFEHIVVIGIGGSYLGTEFISCALAASAVRGIKIHYLANVDIHNFGRIASAIERETTLWIVVSKSYTTAETSANTNLAYEYIRDCGQDPARHVVTVTSKGSPGDNPDNPVLATFHMFDFIGGRYSVTSAVGGVPLSLYLGYDCFERILKGAEEMDTHAASAPIRQNAPLMAALIAIWNNNFLGYPAQAIIPYADPLCKLAPHVQQLSMESNGKSATQSGEPFDEPTGMIIFGEPGTNAQHSFFQLAHQGRPFPVDFIGVVRPQYDQYLSVSKGVTNHQELWANLIAQPMALAVGKPEPDAARSFSGNRPSSMIVLPDLSPESVGRLLSFYEAKTVFEAFAWDINPFDQFGVELGKKLADGVRKHMAENNMNPDSRFDQEDAFTRFYLDMLFK
jgi:glucose-6-phosphate isomerase